MVSFFLSRRSLSNSFIQKWNTYKYLINLEEKKDKKKIMKIDPELSINKLSIHT